MSGDPGHGTIIVAEAESVVARAVSALARFPADQPWVLIGGIAVFIRLGSVTRPTADADTIAKSQASLIDRLQADEIPSVPAELGPEEPASACDVAATLRSVA